MYRTYGKRVLYILGSLSALICLAIPFVILADHNIVTLSPLGRYITLITTFTFLPPSFNPKRVKLNRELSAYLILCFRDACRLLERRGLPEALEALVSIYAGRN